MWIGDCVNVVMLFLGFMELVNGCGFDLGVVW